MTPNTLTPDLLQMNVTCVVGDGGTATGALATTWQSNVFPDPATDGTVLPIPHPDRVVNGLEIAGPLQAHQIQILIDSEHVAELKSWGANETCGAGHPVLQ